MKILAFLLLVLPGALLASAPVPPPPGPESWTFKEELARPVAYHAQEAYRLDDAFGLEGDLETVRTDLERFFASARKPGTKTLTLRRGPVAGRESYRLDVAADGAVTLTAEDADGLRRGACYFEDRVTAGDLVSCIRRPWLRHRISRCYFAPIKRPPFNRDELMDDVNYYPDEYLNRLAHEGVNGLWLTVELRNLVATSFSGREKEAPRRLAKLRRTVERCRRYGIRTWIFCIEPRSVQPDDPLRKTLPAEAFQPAPWGKGAVMCPSSPEVRRYLEEAFRDLFTQVPGLAGVLVISQGERPTTCLSWAKPDHAADLPCPRCSKLEPWQVHELTASSVVRGMRAAEPTAEFLSWFYHPQVAPDRAPWVADAARHLPEGVTMVYNFESGALKDQLGKERRGGDYWLSYIGPSPSFSKVADAVRESGGSLGAKIQVGCSHECATVPFVPVPGLLYRKYKAMREAGCSAVMQCWYFGNYPGVMNKAAGELAFEDFTGDESAFLLKLARPDWGADAPTMARLWQALSDAYANYPLSNDMQYYGPFHAGVAWPLLPDISLRPLGRTWKPLDAPSGDVLGECLENHTLAEAIALAARMAEGARTVDAAGHDVLDDLSARFADDPERLRDLGVLKTLQLLFASGYDILDFYRHRAVAVVASRDRRDPAAARKAVAEMCACVRREEEVTRQMLPLAQADSRIGFHSEAESHQFHPARLRWRLETLAETARRLDEIDAVLASGGAYPLSAHERQAPKLPLDAWTEAGSGWRFRPSFSVTGDFVVEGEGPQGADLTLRTTDACATTWARALCFGAKSAPEQENLYGSLVPTKHVVKAYETRETPSGWAFRLVLDAAAWQNDNALRPAWIHFLTYAGKEPKAVWPAHLVTSADRLNLGFVSPALFGRLVERMEGKRPLLDVQGRIDATAAAGGGVVTVPPGEWETRPFALKSDVTLELAEGAILFASTNLQDYAMQPRGNRYFILAEGVTNVAIRGKGVLSGNGWAFCESRRLAGESQPQDLPVMLRFSRCRDVRLEGFTYRDCGAWGLHLRNCDAVTARRLTCFSHSNRTNDGIDIESSNVVVEDCDFDTGDDAVVFKTESDKSFPVTNVVVRNCRIASECNGIKFGTGSYCDVRDIVIEGCTLRRASPHRKPCDWRDFPGVGQSVVGLAGLALEVVDGGRMENVTVRNLDIEGFMVPLFVRLGRRRAPLSPQGTFLRNVLLENVRAVADSRIASSITGVPGLRPSGLTLRNVDILCRGGGTKADAVRPVPEMEKAYPECIMFHLGWPDDLVPDELVLPAWGLYVRHADDIRLENVRLSLCEPDAREPIVTDDVSGFAFLKE